ncbi:MAG: GGDEF domain-containing protein [Nitrospiraceae bacterium]|nr:GGDEF domain-containing protein [Nitrospiraceae bacterium]
MKQEQKTLVEIIKICFELDKMAVDTYHDFSLTSSNQELKSFWEGMSKEETVHLSFWQDILDLAEEGRVPMLLDNPEDVLKELEVSRTRVKNLAKTVKDLKTVTEYFTFALRLEFYVLQPAFESLFYFMKNSLPKHKGSSSFYDKHLSRFISALKKYGAATPELELIGEAIQKLWETNRDMVLLGSLDPLTRIFNRRGFYNSIKPLANLASRNSMQICFLMMDIDNFKTINDTYGHQKGDEVIRAAADVIKASIRTSDIPGRFGGEEFVVYLSSIPSDSVLSVAEKIRKNIGTHAVGDINFTVSIGAACGTIGMNSEEDIEKLIQTADEAMYKAKRLGKNRVIVAE